MDSSPKSTFYNICERPAMQDTLDTRYKTLTVSKGSRIPLRDFRTRTPLRARTQSWYLHTHKKNKTKRETKLLFHLNLQFLSISEKRLRFPLKLFIFKYSSHFSIIKPTAPIHFTNFKNLKEITAVIPLNDKYTTKYRENNSLFSFLSAIHGPFYEKIWHGPVCF